MKKITILIIAILACAILVFGVPMGADLLGIPLSKTESKVNVAIEDGTGTLGIASVLKDSELIRSRLSFLLFVKTSEYNGRLASGSYELSKDMSMEEICDKLSEPKEVRQTVRITFPEGYSAEQIGKKLEDQGIVSKDEFLKALDDDYDYEFIDRIPKGNYKYRLQGFLFPDTYEFYRDMTAHEIADKMLARFSEVYSSLCQSYDNVFETIIKASLVEKEAKLDSERAMVAGVIENRMEKNMLFQIDASVLYAATEGMYDREDSSFIAKNIKELDSPYNTYKYQGLPAGAICSPGYTSIKAALEPKEHSFLYYHTDTNANDGSHIFTETLSEHIGTMN